MRRPKSHQIDTRADVILKDILPESWIVREQHPDYGLDYAVEIVESEQLTGVTFFVQLKGTSQSRQHGQYVSQALETRHLEYYINKARTPVFLVVINVDQRTGFWCFLQKYAREDLKGKRWQDQSTITIRVPVTNGLADAASLETAVREADKFMADLRPGSPQSAVRAEENRLGAVTN